MIIINGVSQKMSAFNKTIVLEFFDEILFTLEKDSLDDKGREKF